MSVNSSARWRGFALLALVASLAGCQKAPPAPSPAASSPSTTAFTASGWSYSLRRMPTAGTEAAADVPKEWKDLFSEMAHDPETLALLARLHGGLKTEFVVLTAEEAGKNEVLGAPPAEGVSVAMRVGDLEQSTQDIDGQTVPVRVIAYGHVVRLQRPVTRDPLEALKLAREAPLPGKSLNLAMEDFVLRHIPGWVLRSGPVNRDEKLPESVDEDRRELDRRIQELAEQARTFYQRAE